jgi:hypothetical protein
MKKIILFALVGLIMFSVSVNASIIKGFQDNFPSTIINSTNWINTTFTTTKLNVSINASRLSFWMPSGTGNYENAYLRVNDTTHGNFSNILIEGRYNISGWGGTNVVDRHSGIFFRVTNFTTESAGEHNFIGNGYAVYLSKSDNYLSSSGIEIVKFPNNGSTLPTVLNSSIYTFDLNSAYNISVTAYGSTIRLYINGTLMLQATDSTYTTGLVGLRGQYSGVSITDYNRFWSNVSVYEYEEGISVCTATDTKSLKVSTLNEITPFDAINGSVNYNFNYIFPNGTTGTLSGSFINNSKEFCIYPSTNSMSVDGQFQYTGNISGVYSIRDYNFENMIFDNTKDDLNLYLLNDSSSSRITITVKDQYSNIQSGVIVQVHRWYPELNAYKIVASPKTDSNGVTNTYLVAYDVDYAFVLEKDGIILDTIDKQKITADTLLLTIAPTPIITYPYYWNQMLATANYDPATGNITGLYSDSSGYLTGATMYVYRIGALEKSNLCTIYNTSIPSGRLVCHTGNISSSIFTVEIIGNLSTGTHETYTMYSNTFNEEFYSTKLFGNCKLASNALSCKEGAFIALFLVLLAALIGIWNPVISILFMIVSLGVTVQTGLYAISVQAFIGLVFVAFIMMWKIGN